MCEKLMTKLSIGLHDLVFTLTLNSRKNLSRKYSRINISLSRLALTNNMTDIKCSLYRHNLFSQPPPVSQISYSTSFMNQTYHTFQSKWGLYVEYLALCAKLWPSLSIFMNIPLLILKWLLLYRSRWPQLAIIRLAFDHITSETS